ncbi:MAG TPA: D-alanyl-D-alanine carboxypeptidase family protein [Clostridia bacterium]
MKKKLIILFSIVSMLILLINPCVADDENEGIFEAASLKTGPASPGLPSVSAGAAILMDMNSGRVMYDKNARSRRPMASTTKIMTAILAIEKGNLNDVVTVSRRAASVGGSTIDLKAGQKISLRELLYGLMLNSGNDAAIAIAEHIGGSVDGFSQMMNQKASEIGAYDSNFKSPHGLDVEGHYSTAYDLALMARYALNNPVFSKIVSTKVTSISTRGLANTNEMLSIYPGADGVKTGYTGQAGRCLVTSVTRNNWKLISVVLNCASREARAGSSKAILDYGYNNFKPVTLLKEGEYIKDIPVLRGKPGNVCLYAEEGISMPLREDEMSALKKIYDIPENVNAPVGGGMVIGTVRFVVGGKEIASSGVKTACAVKRKDVWDYLLEMIRSFHSVMKDGF